jgi:uncharacterized phage protein (TIGR02218 family)
MRDIPPLLAAHLATGATTLASCWRLTRGDGRVMGFTDHDRDLAFAGTTFLASTAFEGTEVAAELGLAVTGGEVAGALSSAGITEAELEAGLYDAAEVETFLVNWQDVSQRLLLAKASVGEVRRRDRAFTAELRSSQHRLAEARGRLFARACDADLGDARCGVDLSGHRVAGTVVATDGRLTLVAAGLGAAPAGTLDGGRLAWTSGANQGASVEVKRHATTATGTLIELWRPATEPIAPGDALAVTAGCDKSFATCRDRFANKDRFRGFPHIPGNDQALSYARAGGGNDGRSLKR